MTLYTNKLHYFRILAADALWVNLTGNRMVGDIPCSRDAIAFGAQAFDHIFTALSITIALQLFNVVLAYAEQSDVCSCLSLQASNAHT